MEPGEEQLDYGDGDSQGGVGHDTIFQTSVGISAVEEGVLGEEDDYDELYNDLNVGFIQFPAQERIDRNNNGHSVKSQLEREFEDDYVEVRQNSTGLEQDLGYGRSNAMLSSAVPAGGDKIVAKNPALYEDDRSPMVWAAQATNPYDKMEEEADNLATVSGQLHSFSAANVDLPSKDWRNQGSAEAPQSSGGVQRHARNEIVGFTESVSSGKAGGSNVAVTSRKVGGTMSGTPSLRAGNLPVAASASDRTGSTRDSFRTAPNEVIGRHDIASGRLDGSSFYSDETGGTILFVGDLHWWTTDADLESVLSEYGRVKELKFFEEKASGKSKGYCQVEFYDHAAARACKEGMNGHVFNGRPCVVALASPRTVRQLGTAQENRIQAQQQQQWQAQTQSRRMLSDRGGSSYQSGEGGQNHGKMGLGRSGHGQGMSGRGQVGQGRGRAGMGGKSMGGVGGGSYGQGLAGQMGGTSGGMMYPQGMMAQGFNSTFGPHIGRGGSGYGGFTPHGASFPGMIPSFSSVGTTGLPGVAPHINAAFFGRGMASDGMGTMPSTTMDGHHPGMWMDSGMSGWGGEVQRRRLANHGEGAASEYGYNEANHERGRSSATRDSEKVGDADWVGTSERRYYNDRETYWNRESYNEDRDAYRDQRGRDQDWEERDEWEREKATLNRSKGRVVEEEDQRPRPKEGDYRKRRRLASERNG